MGDCRHPLHHDPVSVPVPPRSGLVDTWVRPEGSLFAMQIHFRREGYRPGTNGESGGSVGVVSTPRAILERHGALVLRPGEAVTLPGSRIRSTVYRWGYLLVPNDVLQNADDVALLNRALGPTGLELVAPGPLPGAGG